MFINESFDNSSNMKYWGGDPTYSIYQNNGSPERVKANISNNFF